MEEILPAARLLSRATALSPSDYERAKTLFLSGVDASNLAAQVQNPLHRPALCVPFTQEDAFARRCLHAGIKTAAALLINSDMQMYGMNRHALTYMQNRGLATWELPWQKEEFFKVPL